MESPYLIARRKRECFGMPKPAEKKVAKEIPKQSVKMKKEAPAYKKFIADFLSKPENKYCVIQINENCTRIATVVNHTKRRGKKYKMNPEFCEPSCSYCNIEIENQSRWAQDNGHLKSVHKLDVAIAEYDPEINSIIIK